MVKEKETIISSYVGMFEKLGLDSTTMKKIRPYLLVVFHVGCRISIRSKLK